MKKYLIGYDVINHKRRNKVRKLSYSYAFGGQKSAVEAFLDKKDIFEITKRLSLVMDLENDSIHIIGVKKFLYLGKAKEIKFENGEIIIWIGL